MAGETDEAVDDAVGSLEDILNFLIRAAGVLIPVAFVGCWPGWSPLGCDAAHASARWLRLGLCRRAPTQSNFCHGCPSSAGLAPGDVAQLADVAVPRRWSAGEVVFREGDEGDTCYVIRTGAARVTRNHSDGRAITLAELRRGDIFGELAMWGGETRSATVEALEDTTARGAPRRRRQAAAGCPTRRSRSSCSSEMADRLRAANERITRQSFQTVAGRVACVLLAQVEARSDEGAAERDVRDRAPRRRTSPSSPARRASRASRFLATLERAGRRHHRAREGDRP